MKRFAAVMMVAGLSMFTFACVQKATNDEAKAACATKQKLDLAAKPKPAMPDPVATVEGDFQKKLAELQKQQSDALAAIETELKAKIDKAKGKEQAKLSAELSAKKAAKETEFKPQTDALTQQKAEALKAAQDAKIKADAAVKAAAEKELTACIDGAIKEGVSKPKADCQAAAKNLDEYGKCQ